MFNKNEIKSKINDLLGEIENSQENQRKIFEIRTKIIELMENTINFLDQINEFGLWGKNSMASAMSWLNWNLNKKDITTSWLTICMFKIEKALTDSSQRSPPHPHNQKRQKRDDEINKLESADYINFLNDLKKLV